MASDDIFVALLLMFYYNEFQVCSVVVMCQSSNCSADHYASISEVYSAFAVICYVTINSTTDTLINWTIN